MISEVHHGRDQTAAETAILEWSKMLLVILIDCGALDGATWLHGQECMQIASSSFLTKVLQKQ